ncbi:hypothetical protein SAMD00019534_103770 [Acytostelium subglobosum LB1]|uniref:hypothetical protein n=1 Tax=Acytostelium subglobosum LB1 TaxID=1410327 RepID=UPI000644C536|nr:hypothetical protein SAMD00019534_103770 [Acytostelium subglobosum LB1]GAM27202.1 hypothetical protein SAMD00019534_103770 [Acytostelium subglobosum LB1]|eukprot:XP_012749669.1 hypothetical protein SAMD00019534_103770 [Acytostelium subglobosum LB1]
MQVLKSIFGKGSSSGPSTGQPASQCAPPDNYSNLFFKRLEKKTIQPFCGLNNSTTPPCFELTDLSIETTITDSAVVSVWTQRYKNGNTSPVEAKYQMPLAPQSAVSRFVVTYDDQVLIAKIKEKEAAQNKYSDAIASGNQAFMVEKNDNGTFTTMIGNLPPTKEVTVTLTIVSEIGTYNDEYYFALHRYMFPTKRFKLEFSLDVQLSSPIQGVHVFNYDTTESMVDGKRAKISLVHDGSITKNLIVVIKQQDNTDRPAYFLEKSPTSSTYALGVNFYPQLTISADEVDQRSEFIFLLDCSGSMSGGAIAKAKSALEILMRALTEKSKFNIWLFGSSYKSLFPESKLYNDESLDAAAAYITQIDANLGGTELLPPIQAILKNEYDPQYPRQVFILTDGEVSQRDELIDFVGKEANTTRIFTLGIGGGVDRELVTGLSMACRGYFEFINDNAQMETQVMKLMSTAMEPTISNIKVDWDGLDLTQAPSNIRPVFNHERLMIYALVNSQPSTTTKKLKVTADGPTGQTLTYEIDVDFEQVSRASDSLHTLTANMIIHDLEEKERKQPATKAECKEKIIALGKKYHLISYHTSFVVVAESSTPVEDTMVVVDVIKPTPIVQPRPPSMPMPYQSSSMAYGGAVPAPPPTFSSAPRAPGGMPPQRSISPCPPPPPMSGGPPPPPPTSSTSYMMDSCMDDLAEECEKLSCISADKSLDMMSAPRAPAPQGLFRKKEMSAERESSKQKISFSSSSSSSSSIKDEKKKSVTPSSSGDLLMDLIRSQKANGSWNALLFSVSASEPDVLKALPDVWTTLLVMARLEKSFSAKKTQWEKLVVKAQRWVKSQLTSASIIDQFDALLAQAMSAA